MATKKTDATLVQSHEFTITKMRPGTAIEANFPEIASKIAQITEIYAGAIVSLDYLPQAKKDRAYLNGLTKSVDQRRIEAKNAYMQPYNVFDTQVRELLEPVREASANLDRQIKELEEQEKAAKRMLLVAHYAGMAGVLVEAVPFERIEDPAWLNRTFYLQDGYKAIESVIDRIAEGDKTLDGLNLSHALEAKTEFFLTLDVGKAIAKNHQLVEAEEHTRRVEAEKAANMAALQAEPVVQVVHDDNTHSTTVTTEIPDEQPALWRFEVTCNRAQFDSIISYLRAIGVKGKAVK